MSQILHNKWQLSKAVFLLFNGEHNSDITQYFTVYYGYSDLLLIFRKIFQISVFIFCFFMLLNLMRRSLKVMITLRTQLFQKRDRQIFFRNIVWKVADSDNFHLKFWYSKKQVFIKFNLEPHLIDTTFSVALQKNSMIRTHFFFEMIFLQLFHKALN